MATNKTIYTIEELMNESIRIYPGMIAVWPQFHDEENLTKYLENIPKFNGCYATNNSTVAYIFQDQMFVTPYTNKIVETLRTSAFKESTFYVPFSNGDFPKQEHLRWKILKSKAQEEHHKEFRNNCIRYCEKHHIGGELPQKVLNNCFEMPKEGIDVQHVYFEDHYFPIIKYEFLDGTAAEKLGKYCCNNGRVVFVYHDGKTYVAKGYAIVQLLKSAGYQESGLFVPFSNGETIKDTFINAQWETLPKVSI